MIHSQWERGDCGGRGSTQPLLYEILPAANHSPDPRSPLSAGVLSACDFIHMRLTRGKRVLVHCDAGITRSAAVVVSYLMTYGTEVHCPQHLSLDKSQTIVQQLRERMDICLFQQVCPPPP